MDTSTATPAQAGFTPSLFDADPADPDPADPDPADPDPADTPSTARPWPDPAMPGLRRLRLDARSWVDLVPGWLHGAGVWFDEIVAGSPWAQRRRRMYDAEVLEPRLTCGWPVGEAPDPSVTIADVLGARYRVRFDRVAANYYRDGTDSVAWHGDRVRFTHPAPVVAIVSLGSARRFGLRPAGGGAARWLTVAGGDLLVMGGRCQHEWQHTVPKSVGAGPRVSVTFRHDDPGPAAGVPAASSGREPEVAGLEIRAEGVENP